jgi:hypothetical protein
MFLNENVLVCKKETNSTEQGQYYRRNRLQQFSNYNINLVDNLFQQWTNFWETEDSKSKACGKKIIKNLSNWLLCEFQEFIF